MSSTRGSLGASSLRRTGASLSLALPRRLSWPAWGAVAVAFAFVAITAWWLSVDRGVPYNDAAQHLFFALRSHDLIADGRIERVIDFPSFYPPATFLLGAAAAFVGGVNVTAPILAQNLVYVPLLALGCYQLARMTTSRLAPLAGLLAVLFALGSPLMIEQFHVFMLDAPQAALVAVAAWLVLASERFSRVGIAALAGLALGVGIASKELAPLYLVGLVACVLARGGGWRNWRGLAVFAGVALLVGAPWYLRQFSLGQGGGIWSSAGPGGDVPPAARPALLSGANATWYFWATLDGLLFAPLFAFAAIGVGAAVARVRRARPGDDLTLELLCGLGGAWLALTLMPHHDMRYTEGLIPFLAALGTAWIARLATAPRRLAVGLLVGAIALAHAGATFGVGGTTERQLPGARRAAYGEGVPPRGRVIVYANHDFLVSGPQRHPDVGALLKALRREGALAVQWVDQVEPYDRNFEEIGLWVLARVASLQVVPPPQEGEAELPPVPPGQVLLVRTDVLEGGRPCMRLADGSGVWARAGTQDPRRPRPFCPAL
jgi:4-amino-4-deoxy-L-arabinose transferase-like glycosyltransferase